MATADPTEAKKLQSSPPIIGISLSGDTMILPVTPDEARLAMMKSLTPLWRLELGKFKSEASLNHVQNRHRDAIKFATRRLNQISLTVADTRPETAKKLAAMSDWCRITEMFDTWDDGAERAAELQATDTICRSNAAAAVVVEAIIKHLDKK